MHLHLRPMIERERFMSLIHHAFKAAGATHNLMSDSGMELLRQACQGIPRLAGRILQMGLQLAAAKKLNHLPDDLLAQAIEELR
jgi:type II secretory pathway predicted ATPase ExeA